jgi:hypothetical protein
MANRTERAELPQRLRDAALSHHPDRDRMLARVEQGMTEQTAPPQDVTGPAKGTPLESVREQWHAKRYDESRSGAPWLRIAAVTAAVAGAFGIGGLAVGAVAGSDEPSQSVVTSGGPSASHGPPPHTSPPAPGHHGRDTAHPAAPPSGGQPRATAPPPASATTMSGTTGPGTPPPTGGTSQDGSLSSQASVDSTSNAYWTQNDLVLTTSQPLTALSVEVRVARTEGVANTGSWTRDGGVTTASVTVEGDELVYRWTLNAGQTLAPGSHTFAAQFQHAQGDRDTSGDTYAATSQGSDGSASVSGHF